MRLIKLVLTKRCVFFLLVTSGLVCTVDQANAYHPDSPEVQEMVDKAIEYLESEGVTDSRFGGKCLIAMALSKAGKPDDHPKIQDAVRACREVIARSETTDEIYSLGISIIFLSELDASRYRDEILSLLQILNSYQKKFGGWGYVSGPHIATGDTSMTQYAVLAQWAAYRNGVTEYPSDQIPGVCNWLIRTQDPTGAWGYQGKDPGSYQRKKQGPIRHSLAAAGLSSIYVCADLMGLGGLQEKVNTDDNAIPSALKSTEAPADKPRRRLGGVNAKAIERAMRDGDRWFVKNYQIEVPQYVCYYLYAFERYQSFKEFYEGKSDPEPKWYDEGVEYFQKKQNKHGSWYGQTPEPVATAFTILFLKRSTKKSIQKADRFGGVLAGGRGLPKSSKGVELKDGRLAPSAFQGEVESLLTVLEKADASELESLDAEFAVQLAADPTKRAQQLARLERLVSASDHQVRLTALKTISSARSLDTVPTLIYALSDPDRRVVRQARDGLRFLSRNFKGFGLPDQFTPEEQLEAIQGWKKWYRSIRPDAKFLN